MVFRSPIISNKKALTEIIHSIGSRFFGAWTNSKRDYSAIMENPTNSSLIMAVLLWIVRRWPEAPIYLEDGKGDAIYDHPMLKLLNRPNPNYSGTVLWFGTILSLIWDGNGYMVKIRNPRTLAVEQLWYVPHFLIEPMVNTGSPNFVDYYQYSPGGASIQKIAPEDIIHFRYGIDPYNQRKGMSPLRSIARDAVTDEEADNFSAAMLHNMGVPGLLFSPDFAAGVPTGSIDVEAAKKYIKDHFTGDNRGEPMVQSGPTKIQQFGFDPRAMDLSTLRGVPEERISAVTGIPAAVVGFGSGLAQTKVGATMKELREMAYEDGIIPIQRLVGPEIETQLLDEFVPNPDDWIVKFDLSQVRVLQDDQDALYKRTIEAWNGGLINRAEGKQAIGYDALPTDNIRRVPFSVIETEDGQPLPPPIEYIPPAKGRTAETKARHTRERAFNAIQLRAAAYHQAAYTPELADGFATIADKIVKAYNEHIENTALRARKPSEIKADPIIPIDPNSAEGIGISVEASQVVAAASVTPLIDDLAWKAHYLAVASSTVDNMTAIFGISLDLPDVSQREIISKGGRHFGLVGVDAQTQDAVFKGIADGRTLGQGPREIARAIRSNVEGSSMYPGVAKEAHDRAILRGWSEEKAKAAGDKAARQYRAEVISRTETKYAQNVSTLEAAKASGSFNAMLAFDNQIGFHDSPPGSLINDGCVARDGHTFTYAEAELEAEKEHPSGSLSWSPTITGGA